MTTSNDCQQNVRNYFDFLFVASKVSLILGKNYAMEETINAKIADLKQQLTGDLFQDGELMQEIYELKKQLNPAIVDNPAEDDDDGCLYCGS